MSWFLNFIPSWVPHLIVLLGIFGLAVSFVSGRIPLINNYKLPFQVASAVVLIAGIWLEGLIGGNFHWKEKVNELEAKIIVNEENAKIALAEEKARSSNTKIQYKYVDKIKVVKDVKIVVQEKIKEVATKIDSECKLTPEAIDLINTSAKPLK
ncbi:MAG: hypothetical protein EBU90_22705 [Proteobacteria bacterium]|nr:hypothetical protein [Pseudomonadota bacterium]